MKNNVYGMHVLVQRIPTTVGTKYIALCGSDRFENDDDFTIETLSLKETLFKLKEKVIEMNMQFKNVHILGEFDINDLTEEEDQVWGTPIKDLTIEELAV